MSITRERVLEVLAEVVAEVGADYVYPDDHKSGGYCLYVYNDEPDCIAARVLHRLGATVAYLRGWEGLSSISASRGRDFSFEANSTLRCAQIAQDKGQTYGEALQAARANRAT